MGKDLGQRTACARNNNIMGTNVDAEKKERENENLQFVLYIVQ